MAVPRATQPNLHFFCRTPRHNTYTQYHTWKPSQRLRAGYSTLNGKTGRHSVGFKRVIYDIICNGKLSLNSKLRSANGGESTNLKGMYICILTQYHRLGLRPGLSSKATIYRSMRNLRMRSRLKGKVWILDGRHWNVQIHPRPDTLRYAWRPTR